MMEKNKGFSFGFGRDRMQKVKHDRDIETVMDNPGPGNADPAPSGKVLGKDSVKYSFGGKQNFQDRK